MEEGFVSSLLVCWKFQNYAATLPFVLVSRLNLETTVAQSNSETIFKFNFFPFLLI